MNVFDNVDRTYTGPSKYAEDSFAYFNRSARDEVARVRDLIEELERLHTDDKAVGEHITLVEEAVALHDGAVGQLAAGLKRHAERLDLSHRLPGNSIFHRR